LASEFTDLIEFSKEAIEMWMVTYININDEEDEMLHQLGMDLRDMENELFKIKTNHEIMLAPMREYIEEWLRKSLIKITKRYQQEMVVAVIPLPKQQTPTKEAPTKK
jgi:hypothetical protein